jgi:periplasmic protein TonB
MFDKLVESTNHKTKGRSKFYVVASLIYGTALSVVAVLTIIWFNPGMAEANSMVRILMPSVPAPAPPPELSPAPKVAPAPIFMAPKQLPPKIADPKTVTSLPTIVRRGPMIAGVPDINGNGRTDIPNSFQNDNGDGNTAPPPPPSPAPTPKITPTPAPTPKTPDIVRMTSEMVTGKAVRKVQPPYPQIARAARAQGTVPVQITISEEGRVLDASVVGGNPLLRDAARQAALQWVFSPTVLNGKNVKVSGVISFNFILN